MAPRSSRCTACKSVATIEDLAYRLYDSDGSHLPITAAKEYLRTVGVSGSDKQLAGFAFWHRRHIDKWLARGAPVAPAQIVEGVSRIPAPVGDVSWVDLNKQGMALGAEAIGLLSERVRQGGMEDADLVSVARLGQSAAKTRAEMELKGALKRAESIVRLASGFAKPETP